MSRRCSFRCGRFAITRIAVTSAVIYCWQAIVASRFGNYSNPASSASQQPSAVRSPLQVAPCRSTRAPNVRFRLLSPGTCRSAYGPRRPCGGTDANTSRTVGADGCVPLQKPRTPGFSQVRHPRRARRCASGRAEDTPGTPPCETAPAPAHTGTRSPPGRHGGRGSPAPRNPRRP